MSESPKERNGDREEPEINRGRSEEKDRERSRERSRERHHDKRE